MSDEMRLTPDELSALKEIFYSQTKEMLEAYARHVLQLESARDLPGLLRVLERTVHTVKGDSMALDFDGLARLAHRLEDYLRDLRGSAAPRREQIDLLLACGDRMEELLEAYCVDPGPETLPEIETLLTRLVPSDDAETREIDVSGNLYHLTVWFARDCNMRSAGAFLVRKRLDKLANVLAAEPDPETPRIEETSRWELQIESDARPKEIRRAARVPGVTSKVTLKRASAVQGKSVSPEGRSEIGASPGRAESFASSVATEQLRVEVNKIDRIMNLVGELVIGRSMVAQALEDLSHDAGGGAAEDRLSEANSFLERTLTELQAAVLKIRMVPVEHVFRRFPRVVRDLAHPTGKQVALDIQGGLTELDKGIVDALGEPLLHLVRNAIDHGLETSEERLRAGKPVTGRLTLEAFYEGNHAHVVVEDDGRGIDVARVAERAVRVGLLDAAQLDDMTPSEILNTIYHPGFTTKEIVSEVSGRGIGMDVVRESIESLKGVIELETAPGRGTRFLIRLPLTLAILRAVLVEADGKAFAVPLTGVLEIVRLQPHDARSVVGRRVLHWRDRVVPLVSLRDALGLPSSGSKAEDTSAFVLLVGEAERRVGLVADRLLGEGELVVKPIEDSLSRSPGIAGASILGDGRVVLILHTRGLLDENVNLSRKVEVLR